MNYRRRLLSFGLLLAMFTLGGCDYCEPPTVPVMPDLRLKPAALIPDDLATSPSVVEVKVPVASPQLRPIGFRNIGMGAQTGAAAIAAAKAGGTTQPTTDGFLNAIQYYDYAPGVVYTAITSPGYVTTIALRANEKLITASAGDTVRWLVDSVQSGSGDAAQTLLIVKPRKAGLQTNLLITTDQRIYTLDLTSVDTGVYHTMIAWNYPFGEAVIIRNQVAAQQAAVQATVATGVDLSRANFNYSILRQKHSSTPLWCPLRAFDDGRKTYIQFPPKVAVTEAPPLFVMGRTATGNYLLIPQGAKLLGKYQSLVSNGQNRALLVWQRLIYPNGNSIVLDGMPGTDETGASGLADKVDYHLDKLVEATALTTALAYAGNLARNPNSSSGNNGNDVVGDTVAQQANRIGEKIIDRELDVQPTITVRQGWPLRVLVNKDMILEPYVP